MSGRSHDYHCPKCHTWVSAFDLHGDLMCLCGDEETMMFYDPNHEGCGPCSDKAAQLLVMAGSNRQGRIREGALQGQTHDGAEETPMFRRLICRIFGPVWRPGPSGLPEDDWCGWCGR